jgi:bacterioferritin-associated ferredoxin
VAVGHGLVPATEVPRLLGAEHDFVNASGGWVPRRDRDLKTTVDGLSVAGDGCGIVGAAAAALQGQRAGLAVARDLGHLDDAAFARETVGLVGALARAERFGHAMAVMMAPRPSLIETATADTVVCRCEDVTRADIESAMAAGAREINQLKSWTRCGMGPCQGRMCGEAAATLVAAHSGGRVGAGVWTARAPLRPLSVHMLTGDFVYDDIPKRAPAPA